MGRQITVEFAALESAGARLTRTETTVEDPYLGTQRRTWVTVHFGSGRTIVSDAEDCLVFDCRGEKSRTYWVERWLVENNVPYFSG